MWRRNGSELFFVDPDGQRLYYLDRRRDQAPTEIVFLTGWQRR